MLVDIKIALSRPIVPQLLCVVLGLLLIGEIASGIYSFFLLDKARPVAHDKFTEAQIKSKLKLTKAGLSTPFYGDYVPKNLNDGDVKQSMLNLKVVGIMFDKREMASHVIIRTAGGLEQTFNQGDKLPGGAIIKRITPEGVLISRNGSLERLSLPKNALIFDAPAKPLGSSK